MTQLRELDVVRVARLDHGNREFDGTEGCKREPRIGDTGTIVHDYAPGDANARVAVEMVNDSGLTIWLADFAKSELELVHAYRAPS